MKKSFKKLGLEKQTVSKLVQTHIHGAAVGYPPPSGKPDCRYQYSRDWGNGCFDQKEQ